MKYWLGACNVKQRKPPMWVSYLVRTCKLLNQNCTLLLVDLLFPVIDQQALCQCFCHFLHSADTALYVGLHIKV